MSPRWRRASPQARSAIAAAAGSRSPRARAASPADRATARFGSASASLSASRAASAVEGAFMTTKPAARAGARPDKSWGQTNHGAGQNPGNHGWGTNQNRSRRLRQIERRHRYHRRGGHMDRIERDRSQEY